MEKFGVEEEPLDKTATAEKPVCPECGAKLRAVEDTGVLLCPNCGSKPFEKS